MRPKLFYIIVVLLYLSAPYFVHEYMAFNAVKQDQASIESGIVNTSSTVMADQISQQEEIDRQEQDLKFQSYGYLGASIFLVLCPTFMLFFRRRIII